MSARHSLPAGTPVPCEMTKWGDRPHWRFTGVHLGSDAHGEWVGFPRGTHNSRPGYEFVSQVDSVTLVAHDTWSLATFHAPGIWCDLYIDVTTPPVWDGGVLRAVDLDLDVIRLTEHHHRGPVAGRAGEVVVDDEDEFEEHRVAFGYPATVVEAARLSCDRLVAAVRAGTAPYDGTHLRWLAELSRRG